MVALDLGIDMTTPNGQLVANVLVAVAQWERQMISERTKEGLAVTNERGTALGGHRGVAVLGVSRLRRPRRS